MVLESVINMSSKEEDQSKSQEKKDENKEKMDPSQTDSKQGDSSEKKEDPQDGRVNRPAPAGSATNPVAFLPGKRDDNET